MLNFNGQCHPYLTDFLEMVKIAAISGRYHIDMKILKILDSNFKQIDDDRRVGGGGGSHQISLINLKNLNS